jgi:putative ABC transport system substrate-binding protein
LAVATTGGARAEQSRKAYRIASVVPAGPVTRSLNDTISHAFFNELRRLGYVEGDNLLVERFSGEGRAAHFPDLAQEVVRRKPDVIISSTTPLTLDFKAATTTIPIVGMFAYPVENGVVSSLARPGSNITGVAVNIGEEQWDKRVQLQRPGAAASNQVGGPRHATIPRWMGSRYA